VEQAAAAAESMQEQAENLGRAVATFRLSGVSEGSAVRGAERRDVAKRPANVARLAGKTDQARPPARRAANAANASPQPKTGTDGEWAEF
jgi:hypothetical protein